MYERQEELINPAEGSRTVHFSEKRLVPHKNRTNDSELSIKKKKINALENVILRLLRFRPYA